MPDHTIRKYSLKGELINDFCFVNVCKLEYEKDEIQYRTIVCHDDYSEATVPVVESYHPKATARLKLYVAGHGYKGLIADNGHVVTMPLYQEIEAINHDLYLCTTIDYVKVIVNGKGETVK